MMVIGTTISLMLTVTVAAILDARHRAGDRHLTTMMVVGVIRDFEDGLQSISMLDINARIDSLASSPDISMSRRKGNKACPCGLAPSYP